MPPTPSLMKKDTLINVAILVLTLLSLVVLVQLFGGETLQQYVEAAGPWAPLAMVIAKASTMVIAPLSGSLLYPLSGTLFGFWWGLVFVLLGDALGGTISFWISRLWGRALAERILGADSQFLNKALEMMGSIKGFLITRAFLAPMPEVATYAAGLTKLPFIPFLLIHMMVGVFPATLLTGVGSLILEGVHPLILLLVMGGSSLFGALAIVVFMYVFGGSSLAQFFADFKEPPKHS